jgi:hypothetical protein
VSPPSATGAMSEIGYRNKTRVFFLSQLELKVKEEAERSACAEERAYLVEAADKIGAAIRMVAGGKK